MVNITVAVSHVPLHPLTSTLVVHVLQSLSIALCTAANTFGTPMGCKYMVRADVIPGWLDVTLRGETRVLPEFIPIVSNACTGTAEHTTL